MSTPLTHTLYPVMPTPLTDAQAPDLPGIQACVRFYQGAGLGGITVLGSGGELPYFFAEEQQQILRQVRETAGDSLQIITGIHAFSTRQALEKVEGVSALADAVLLLLDNYYRVPFADYVKAIGDIAAQSPVPVLLYYFPQITGQYLSSTQLATLLLQNNVIGIKDSALHLPTARKLLNQLPDTLYFSGLSLMLKHLYPIRPCGAICPISALLPQQALQYLQSLENNNQADAQRFYEQLQHWLPVIGSPGLSGKAQDRLLALLNKSPIPLMRSVTASHAACKEALRQLGLPIQATVRSPLPSLDNLSLSAIVEALRHTDS